MKRIYLAILLWACCGSSASAANPYNETLTIPHPGTKALTNYQVKVIVNTAQLISLGRMQADCDDIRFADSTGAPASHWIQAGCNTTQTTLWVKVPILNPGSNTIRISYGDLAAPSASDGNATFLFFDGFDGVSLDTAKWTIQFDPAGSGGTGPDISVGGGNLTMVGDAINSGEGLFGPLSNDLMVPVAFGIRAKRDAGWADINASLVYPSIGVVITGIQNYGQYFGAGFPSQIYRDFTAADNNWHDYETLACNRSALYSISNVVNRYRIDGADLTGLSGQFWMRTWGNATMVVHYVFARKMDPEFEGYADPTCVSASDPSQVLTGLVAAVQQLVSNGSLDFGNGNALNAKLNAAIASLKKGNSKAACNQLNAFVNQVQALLRSGHLAAAGAQPLLDAVTQARGMLGCTV